MNLRKRLSRLREQSGAQAAIPKTAELPDLRQRLAQHGRGRRIDETQLATQLSGELLAPGIILRRHSRPLRSLHGRQPLCPAAATEAAAFFGHKLPIENVIFVDTETSGLSGGVGTIVFLLGLTRFQDQAVITEQYFLTGFHGEAAMLDAVRPLLANSELLVTFNGRSFDAPLLQARYRLAGIADPLGKPAHLDLLHPTRRAFAGRWPDCRLQTAEQRLLGFTRRDDLPGAEAPAVWFDWVRHGRPGKLARVCAHNADDLLSLVALLPSLQQGFERPSTCGAAILAGARHHLDRRDEEQAFRHLLVHRDQLDPAAAMELARLARRREDWPLAVGVWREWAQQDRPEALERLAMYYEHTVHDIATALPFARRLVELQPREARHRKRLQRLLDKSN